MRRAAVLSVLLALLYVAPAWGMQALTDAVFTEFTGGVAPGFSVNGSPSGATAGPDGSVWFAEQANPGRIARITPSGAVTELTGGVTSGLTAGARPANLTAGPDGNVWVTGFADPGRIWRVTPAGAVTEMATGGPTPAFAANTQPTGITAGPDGDLWFAGFADPGRVMRITPAGVVTEVAFGGQTPGFSANGRPRGITTGPDGNVWVAEFADPGRIARVTPSGVVTEFTGGVTPGFTANSGPVDITAGADGNLWFTEQGSPGRIGRITPSGVVTEFGGFTADRQPTTITTGPDGSLWFTEQADPGGVGRITTAGAVTELAAGSTPGFSANRQPTAITAGPGGDLWFTSFRDPGAITRIAPAIDSPISAPGAVPGAPGPGSGSGAPGSSAPVTGPRVTAVGAAAPIQAGRPALLSAQVSGTARRLEWDVDGDGRTDATCSGDQTTLGFRAAATTAQLRAATTGRFTGRVSVKAVGADGTSAVLSATLPVMSAPATTGDAAITRRVGALVAREPPVYVCGAEKDLPAARGELSARADLGDRFCLSRTIQAGTLRVEGCLKAIRSLEDLPPAERGTLTTLALTLGLGSGGSISTGIRRLAGVAFSLTDSYVAVGPVLVNGVELEPRGAARIVVYAQLNQILSSDAEMNVGGIKLAHQRDFSLDTKPTAGGRIPLGAFARVPSAVKGLGAFRLAGDVAVTLEPGVSGEPAGSLITTTLELPDFLDVGGGRGLARVTLRVTTDGELVLDDLHIGPLSAGIGPLGASDLQLDYSRATREWRGQAKLCVVVACLDAVERVGQAPPAGVIIRDGQLQRAFVNLTFPDPGIALYPPYVYLNRIGAGLGLNPTRFLGNAGVTALGIYGIDGRITSAFPSSAAPYRLTREEMGNTFRGADYDRTYTRFTLAVAGDARLKVPLIPGGIRLGGAYLLYEAPGYVHVGGDVEESFFGVIKLIGRTSGELNVANGRFSFGQDIEACIFDLLCRKSITRLSSVGVGGCQQFGPLSIGGGVQYSPFRVIAWPLDGCKWSRFEDDTVADGRAAPRAVTEAAGPLTVKIARGDPSRAIRLDAADGAPRVRITAPGGRVTVSPVGAGVELTPAIRIMRSLQLKATIVGLQDPRPGVYTIETMPGSPVITRVSTAEDPPDARVTASVRGRGARRALVYDVRRRPGQRVSFVETGPGGDRPIGTVGGGRGTLAFTPAPGGGRRRVEAQFELAGIGAERRVVATFTAPPARLGRPARLRVGRRGATLRASWSLVAGATGYEVVVTSANGGQRRVATRGGRARISRVGRASGGRLSVRAVAPMRQGAVRTVRFKANARRAATRFAPLPRPSPRR